MKLNLEQISSITNGAEYVSQESGYYIVHRFTKEEEELFKVRKEGVFLKKTLATSGIKFEFKTDASQINLSMFLETSGTRFYYIFEVYSNAEKIAELRNIPKEEEPNAYASFKGELGDLDATIELPKGDKEISIVFPWSVIPRIKEIEIVGSTYIEPIKHEKKMLIYGDSITQGYDAVYPSKSYASMLRDAMGVEAINKAIGGEIFFPELPKQQSRLNPDYISVAYGTNDWSKCLMEDFEPNCEQFYEALAEHYPNAKIFALAPIRRTVFHQTQIGEFSRIANKIRQTVEKYPNVIFIDCFDFVPNDNMCFADRRLHPNDDGFEHYFKNLYEEIKKHL